MKNLIIISLLFLAACTPKNTNIHNTSAVPLPERASPFTAVDWEEDVPKVEFNGEWYYFEKLDELDKGRILDYCKKTYGNKWKKRFSEDLIDVLKGLDYTPNVEVQLTLRKEKKVEKFKAMLTYENRQKVWMHNNKNNIRLV